VTSAGAVKFACTGREAWIPVPPSASAAMVFQLRCLGYAVSARVNDVASCVVEAGG
jgi:hypothetical protein